MIAATKPRIRITADGWIRHDGSGMPVPGDTPVDVRFADGGVFRSCLAGDWHNPPGTSWWALEADLPGDNITHFRIISTGASS